MTLRVPEDLRAQRALENHLARRRQVRLAHEHPAHLLRHVKCVDTKTGDKFVFDMGPEPALDEDWVPPVTPIDWETTDWSAIESDAWRWQIDLLEWWLGTEQTICLKGRQLGVTWVAGGLALWYLLYKPGSDVLVYSVGEAEAIEVVQRIWDMFESLPEHLKNGVQVIKPSRGARPTTVIEVKHRDGRISSVTGMPGTKKAGHSRTAALVILDELSRQDYARDIWKAVIPTMEGSGRVIGISTANGVSNELTGDGNFFHHLWINSGGPDYPKLETRFLRWSLHPNRDKDWYDSVSLDAASKAEQYPNEPNEAFLLSGRPFFDKQVLKWWAENGVRKPIYRFDFESDRDNRRKARLRKSPEGVIHVFEEPFRGNEEEGPHDYAIAVDLATGRGTDFTVAVVIDLATQNIAAEMHCKMDADEATEQVHFLGKWYNEALIAPENQGGYGETMIVLLRDGKNGRPPYRRLYRYRTENRPDQPESKPFGFPMNQKTRPLVIDGLQKTLREKLTGWVTAGLMGELWTFVRKDSGTSPRAEDGCNDDRVMCYAIAFELYREHGHHPDRVKRTKRKRRSTYVPPHQAWK